MLNNNENYHKIKRDYQDNGYSKGRNRDYRFKEVRAYN